ncbi:hypothetical protein AVEN_37775-1 [Araneus ventricosus]|uniref:Uncharacterized protein n=1 Tax=Araneus ventricosus TaxID=182803 RepID=A0A4Y2KVU3_ARAVE|nr:hypothetical protein AVEN_37775-1 [Araneus ventricosus]
MRIAATSARAKYMQYLESERSKEKTETKQLKRKALEEEIDFLKQKKMFLQTDLHQTNEKANDLAKEAETSKDINLFIQSHEPRKTVSEKEIKINTLDVKLNEKNMAQNLLCNPELLRKLQQMQQTIQQNALNSELGLQGQQPIKNESEEIPYSSDLPSSPSQQPVRYS